MRSSLGALLAAAALTGCGTTTTDIDAATERWKQRIVKEVPIGTNAAVARQWFEKQGLQPYSKALEKSNDITVLLESIPAREWFCSKWMVTDELKMSPDSMVAGYDFGALGQCL